jgi:hypothetical protein
VRQQQPDLEAVAGIQIVVEGYHGPHYSMRHRYSQ